MSDSSVQINTIRNRSGSRLTVVLTVVGLILVVAIAGGIAGFTAWRNSVSASNDRVTPDSMPAFTVPVDVPSPVAAANAAPSVNDLRETVAALQSTQKQILDEIGNIKQKIAFEQGERKLLNAQLGSLSLRLEELSAVSAAIAESPPTEQSQKRTAKSR